MLELETNKGMFLGYVNLYKYMEDNDLGEIEIISIKFYSKHLEFIRNNAINLFNRLFQKLGIYTFEQIKEIVY